METLAVRRHEADGDFTHGSGTYTFVAQVGAKGKVTAKVDHPVTKVIWLVAQMQVAGAGTAGAAPPAAAGPNPSTALLRWEQGVHEGPATDPQRYAAVEARMPIVLTPQTVVNTVDGGSSCGYRGGYTAAAHSYSAPAAPPVASSTGSVPH